MLKLLILFSLVAVSLQEDHLIFMSKNFSTAFSHCTHQNFPSNVDPDNRPTNPIQKFHYIIENGQDFPCGVEAVITRANLVGSKLRTNFDWSFNAQMRALGARVGDEKGHLVAAQFGGPAAWYNLAPQTAALNRNLGKSGINGWFNEELRLGRHLRANRQDVVQYKVAINYDLLNSTRPIGFRLNIQQFNNRPVPKVIDRYFVNEDDIFLK